ncbi:MAG TPA: hypothetical protein VFR83_12320, partial [Burkholderiales bacterium]|nr:hypothetical protein [Burkholderiales bacterium]
FEAMTTTQFHRDAIPVDKAAQEIAAGAGRKFDPKLVEAFQKALPVMKKVRETYSDALGDLINLDFAPKGAAKPAAPAPPPQPAPVPSVSKPKLSATELARAAAKKHR